MPLSEAACRNAKPKDRPYKVADGEGLYLFVQPNGSRLWRLAYRFDGKQKTLAFGAYPHVSLSDARKRREQSKKLLASGKDPARATDKPVETFESVARRWFEKEKQHTAQSHWSRVISRVEREAMPAIGAMPFTAIEPPDVLAILRRIEGRGSYEVAKRLRQSISAIFRFGIAEGHAKFNPAADVGEALKPSPKIRHFSMVRSEEVSALVAAIDGYQGEPITRLALLFTLHTFVRTNEVRFATWDEIDGDLWRIPPGRMKMRREHLVPLTPQALDLLTDVRRHQVNEFIFPGQRGNPMSENTMIYGLYRLGYHSRQTVHGFRRLASTILNEAGFPSDHIERQLAHVEENKIRGAYNAAEWLPGRRDMMVWWSSHLDARRLAASEQPSSAQCQIPASAQTGRRR